MDLWPVTTGRIPGRAGRSAGHDRPATAQRGALDWKPKFKKATLPVFKTLYESVKSGKETKRVIEACGRKNYKELLDEELSVMGNSEMWRAGKAVRALRPKEKAKVVTKATRGVAGRKSN